MYNWIAELILRSNALEKDWFGDLEVSSDAKLDKSRTQNVVSSLIALEEHQHISPCVSGFVSEGWDDTSWILETLDTQPEINKGLRMSLDFFHFVMQRNSPKSLSSDKTYYPLLGIFRILLQCLEITFWPSFLPQPSQILGDSLRLKWWTKRNFSFLPAKSSTRPLRPAMLKVVIVAWWWLWLFWWRWWWWWWWW